MNREIALDDDRIVRVLRDLTGLGLPPSRDAWAAWWTDQLGYDYRPPTRGPKPEIRRVVPPGNAPAALVFVDPKAAPRPLRSCFAEGTAIVARRGLVPIEELARGDEVLAQDPTTGLVRFRAVVALVAGPPAPILRVAFDEAGPVLCTPIHRFWSPGRGWTLARDLRPGEAVRSLDRLERVRSISAEADRPIFNLEVAHDATFFAGTAALLVHDETLADPNVRPFDAIGARPEAAK